jgi:hypothetical protein
MSDERPAGLVDRAYDVGAFATGALATSGAALPDRRGLIRALGIVQIVLGGLCALVAAFGMVTMALSAAIRGQPTSMLAAFVYAVPAINLLVTGIGSVRLTPSARRATLISAILWLPLILLGVVGFLVVQGGPFARGGERVMLTVILVPMLLILVGLPITLIAVYTRPSVRQTFEGGRRAS